MIYTIALYTGVKVGVRTRVCIWYVGMHVCMGVYGLALGCMYGIAHRDLRTCAVSLFSHTHMCVQHLLQLHRNGGSAAHCCSTCLQLHTPNTRVSAIHSLLACVGSSGSRLCMVCTCAVHWKEQGIRACLLTCTYTCAWLCIWNRAP
jgi:hypothetical protein